MSGSIKWFKYTTDGGEVFAFRADESNIEAIGGSGADYADADDTPVNAIPRNIKPRTLRYVSEDGRRTKNIIAPTLAVFNNPTNPITPDGAGGDSFRLKSVTGQKITAPLGFDTGLNDGDAT
jgi:hypothetical protein